MFLVHGAIGDPRNLAGHRSPTSYYINWPDEGATINYASRGFVDTINSNIIIFLDNLPTCQQGKKWLVR